jgi:hypothetical protein
MTDPIEPVAALPPDLDPDVARWLEMAEARAYFDAYTAAAGQPGNPAGAAATVIGEAVAFGLTAIDVGFFNRTIGLGIPREATRDDVDSAASFYRGLGLARSAIQVAPGARPPDLPDWISAEGYALGGRWVKLWHDLREIDEPPPALRIERIDTSLTGIWADACLAAFGMPPQVRPIATATIGRPGWAHYLGYDGETPVSTAAMRIEDDIAWLGYGATLESSRGRGWQTAMLLRRLRDARDAGCRLAVTETGEETEKDPVNHSYRNMLRAGFHLGYARRNWYRA